MLPLTRVIGRNLLHKVLGISRGKNFPQLHNPGQCPVLVWLLALCLVLTWAPPERQTLLFLLEKEGQNCDNKSSSKTFHLVTAFKNLSCFILGFILAETWISAQDRSAGCKRPERVQLPRVNILLVFHKFLNSDLGTRARISHHLSHVSLKRIQQEFTENKVMEIAQQASTSPAAPRKS